MKRPLFLAALAATTALSFVLSGSVRAYNTASTTAAPNPSGYATCTGINTDASTATWTIGGVINYTCDYNNPPSHFAYGQAVEYLNYHQVPGGPGYDWRMTTSSNVKPGIAVIRIICVIDYTAYPGNAGHQNLSTTSYPTVNPNTTYSLTGFVGAGNTPTFADMLDVNNVQYKVTSGQTGGTFGKVATPYL